MWLQFFCRVWVLASPVPLGPLQTRLAGECRCWGVVRGREASLLSSPVIFLDKHRCPANSFSFLPPSRILPPGSLLCRSEGSELPVG